MAKLGNIVNACSLNLLFYAPLNTGKAGEMIDRGDNTYGGKYVINPSGGLISKGHPLGATGMKILCLKQNMAQQDYYFESTTDVEYLIVVQCNYRVWCSHTATHFISTALQLS